VSRLTGRRKVSCAVFVRGTSSGASGRLSRASDQSRSRRASQPSAPLEGAGRVEEPKMLISRCKNILGLRTPG
jgi:hypothetical protein